MIKVANFKNKCRIHLLKTKLKQFLLIELFIGQPILIVTFHGDVKWTKYFKYLAKTKYCV